MPLPTVGPDADHAAWQERFDAGGSLDRDIVPGVQRNYLLRAVSSFLLLPRDASWKLRQDAVSGEGTGVFHRLSLHEVMGQP